MKTTYQPKGSMCAACTKKNRDCSGLPFNAMAPIMMHKYFHDERTVIVRCSEFVSTEREFTK